MRNLVYFLIVIMVLTLLYGCGKKTPKMHSAPKNKHGLTLPQGNQTNKGVEGKDTMIIIDEVRYPGMVQYDTAKYDFTSEDSPETIGEWFLANLKGSFEKNKGDGTEWIIIYKDTIINIVPYAGTGSLLRYKTNI